MQYVEEHKEYYRKHIDAVIWNDLGAFNISDNMINYKLIDKAVAK